MLYLDGKIGIVTGAAGGLGFEIAKELTKNGATVIITSRKKSKLTKINKAKSTLKYINYALKSTVVCSFSTVI